LDVRCELAKSLAIWNNGSRCVALNGGSKESEKTEEKRNIFLYKLENTEMLSYWTR
jgi:hypothetical protein